MNKLSHTELNYRVFGVGHPVVFLHGFLESMSMWDYLDITNYQAVLVDLPGHGQSTIDQNETIASMAAKVITTMSRLGISEFDIIGHSMGGYVGLEVLNQSSRPHNLMLMHSNFWQDSEQKQVDRERVANIVRQKKDAFLYEAIPNLFNDPSEFDGQIRKLLNEALAMNAEAISISSLAMKNRENHTDLVREFCRRVTVVQGINDSIVSLEAMRSATIGIELSYHEIESGHMSHIERPTELQRIIDEWAKKNGN